MASRILKFLRPFHEAMLVSEAAGQWTKRAIRDTDAWRSALKNLRNSNKQVLVPLLKKRQDSTGRNDTGAETFFLLAKIEGFRNTQQLESAHNQLQTSFDEYKKLLLVVDEYENLKERLASSPLPEALKAAAILKAVSRPVEEQEGKISELIASVSKVIEQANWMMIGPSDSKEILFLECQIWEACRLLPVAEKHLESLKTIQDEIKMKTKNFKQFPFSALKLAKTAAWYKAMGIQGILERNN